jgi:hypothetical protein
MKTLERRQNQPMSDPDIKDAIIEALYIRLKAERETRDAINEAARAKAAPEVIEALASDPVPFDIETPPDRLVETLMRDFERSPLSRISRPIDARK